MDDQTIDYGALADQARKGTTPPAGIDYSALASQARGEEQEPIGYRNGMPVYSIDVYGRAGPPPQPPVFQGMDAEGKPIIASPPGPPPSPIPYDLQTLHQQKETTPTRLNPRTGLPMTPLPMGTVPLLDLPYTQGKEVIGGFERMAEPFGGMRSPADAYTPGGMEVAKGGGREQAGAASQIIRGTMGALTPLLPGAFIAAPVATAATLGAYTALGSGTEAGLNWAGVKPEYSALVSDLVSLYGAHRTLKWMGKIANLPYDREAESIKPRLDAAMEQANDPNATPMDRAAAKARVGALMDGLKEAEAGSPGGYFLPQVSIGRTPGKPWVKNQLNPIEQSSQDFLRERGIDTPLSMQTGSPQAADLEGAVRRSTGGGFAAAQGKRTLGQVQELGPREFANIGPEVTPEEAGAAVRGKLAGDLEQQRKALVDQVSPVATTPELAGAKVLEKGKQTIRQFDQAADEAYKAAWEAEKDPRNIRQVPTYDKNGREILDDEGSPVTEAMALPVDVTDVAEKLKPIADKYERTLSDTDARASLGLKAMRNFILDAKQYPKRPLSAVETDLGMFKEAARNENIPELRDTSQGLAAASVKALQAKIDATMAQAYYPGWDGTGTSPALRHLQSGRLNTARKYEVADIYKPFGRNIEQVEPVAAFKRMTWSGDAGIEHLRKVATIAPEHMPEVGRAFIDNGGKWGMLGPETKKELFKDPELIKNLDEYFAKHEKFGGLTEMNPVDLFNKLTASGGKPNELLADLKQHAPEQMPGLLRAFVGELWDRSTREGNIQKVQSTLDQWLNMDPKTKSLMVDDPQTVRNLDNLFFSLKRLNKEVNPSGSGYIVALNAMKSKLLSGAGITAGSLLGYSHGGTGQAGAGVGLGIMAGVGAEALVNKGLARVLFDPKLNKLLTQGIKFQLQGNNEGARLIGETLSRRLSGEQPPPEGQPPSGGGPPSTPPEGGGGAAPAEEALGPEAGSGVAKGSLQERLQTAGDEALDRVRKSGALRGTTMSSLFPAEVTKDMATWGAARIANGAIDFGKWSKAMLADAADISPEAAARVKSMLPGLYAQAKKEYEHHAQTIGAQNIADLPKIMEYYRAGKEGKNWYNFVKPALQPLFGENTDLFLRMFAATSPNTKVTQNVLNAVKAYRQFLTGEPFTGMPAHVDNLNRAVAGVKMSGPKVGAFGPNLLGNLTPVTVDLWMARAILGRDKVTPLQSKLVDYMTSQAAKKAGLEPAEMQAAVWTGIKKLQKSRDTSAPPEVIVKEYLDKNPEIRKLFEDSLEMSKEHFAGLQSKQAPAKPPRN